MTPTGRPASPSRSLSIVIPALDEAESIPALATRLLEAQQGWDAHLREVIIIDDGSRDETWNVIRALRTTHPDLPVVARRFRRNFGKAVALDLGFRLATGDIIVTMDADLQDDPHEIGALLGKIDEGFDLVSGWKAERHDPISKTIPSRFFNIVTSWMTGLRLHDFNCGLKAYRRETVQDLRLYGELHRFIPVLAASQGFRVSEVAVKHHPRRFGVSKYGWRRFLRGFLDLLTVVATTRYLSRPAHLFGGLGVMIGTVGFGVLIYLSALWFLGHGPIGQRPLLLFGVLCVLSGTQLVSFGLLAELFTRRISDSTATGIVGEAIDRPKPGPEGSAR